MNQQKRQIRFPFSDEEPGSGGFVNPTLPPDATTQPVLPGD